MSEQELFKILRESIIKDILKELYKNHTIRDKNDKIVDQVYLVNLLLDKYKCKSINNKMIQCKKNSVSCTDYCEKHYKNNFLKQTEELVESNQDSDYDDNYYYITSLNKKLIENKFYFIDNKYNCFYDKDCNKVGIIKDSEYIFSTNPFLFEQF